MIDFNTGSHYPIVLKNLPETWCAGYIEQFTLHVESGFACGEHNSEGYGVTHLRPMNISRIGQIDLSDYRSVPKGFNEKRLHENDVLFNNTNSPELIGKTAYVPKKYSGLAFSNHMTRLNFHPLVVPRYAALQLHYLWMMKYYLHRCVKHVNQASISTQDMAQTIPFVLPPFNEQKRIVAKIEELFSELENGITALKTAREQLKVYREAILKYAFEGKLTAKWREENTDKLETAEQLLARIQQERDTRYQQQLKVRKAKGKPAKPKEPEQITSLLMSEVQDLYQLPEGWVFLRLGNFIDKIDAGKSFKCDEREPTSGEIGVAKVSAVTWGEYDESESKTCLDAAKVNPDYFIKSGDFILSRANTIELVGACVIARRVTKPIMLSDKTLRINFNGINNKYVLQYLRSHFGRNEIMKRSTGNQESMRNIGQDRIQSIVIPVCGSSEMDLIDIVVNEKLESISHLSKEIEVQLLKAETLRQSILKKAFSGKLVPQSQSDEPGSELLAQIRAEKEQQKQSVKKSTIKHSRKKVNSEA